MSLPWFLRSGELPESTSTAQAVWIYGQWYYLPISFSGIAILRFCTSIEAAQAVVFEFEKERYDIRVRLHAELSPSGLEDRKKITHLARIMHEGWQAW